jgi:phenylalanyl-tRNA synthetase alpha chain
MKSRYNLTSNEKILLISLEKLRKATPGELAQNAGMKIETAMQAAFLLEENGLARVDESIIETYELTGEGQKYASEGLPERKVIDAISEPIPMQELKQRFSPDVAGIATGWLRRKGWANIENGVVVPTGNAGKGKDEHVLERFEGQARTVEELGTPFC